MATYGYSTPYTGQRQPTLPPGYMEAATAPGRNIAAGIQQFGAGIGQAIQQYQKNKDENDYLNAKIEAGLAQYAQAGIQGPLPSGATADLQNLTGIVGDKSLKRFIEGTATKGDKLAMAHALETYGQKELQALNRRQLELSISEAERALKAEQDISDLTRYAAGLPSTRTMQEQVPVEIQPIGPMPAAQAEAPVIATAGGQRSPTEAALAQRFLTQAGIAGQQLRQYAEQQIKAVQPPSEGRVFAAGATAAPVRPAPLMTQSPQQAALAQELYRRELQAAQSAAVPMREQADIMTQAASRPLQYQAPVPAATPRPTDITLPAPVTVQEQTQRTEPIPYAETRRNLAQYAASMNMSPKAFQALDKVMEVAGMQKPLQVEQMTTPEGISVIRADGKIDIIPPVRQPNQQPSEADKAFVMNINGYLSAAEDLKSTIDKYGNFEVISPTGAANLKSIPYQLAIMYAKIMDPGSVAREGEVEAAKKYLIPLGIGVRQSESLAAINRQIKEMKKKGALYQQMTGRPAILSQDQLEKVNTASGQFRLVRGQGIKPVQ